jgi:hypothetical protein
MTARGVAMSAGLLVAVAGGLGARSRLGAAELAAEPTTDSFLYCGTANATYSLDPPKTVDVIYLGHFDDSGVHYHEYEYDSYTDGAFMGSRSIVEPCPTHPK